MLRGDPIIMTLQKVPESKVCFQKLRSSLILTQSSEKPQRELLEASVPQTIDRKKDKINTRKP